MEDQFVPYNIALKLKELGFNEDCFLAHAPWGYMLANDVDFGSDIITKESLDDKWPVEDEVCLAPLWQQAFEWFREEYLLDSHIVPYWFIDGEFKAKRYIYSIEPSNRFDEFFDCESEEYDTNDEARLACLEKLIEIIS